MWGPLNGNCWFTIANRMIKKLSYSLDFTRERNLLDIVPAFHSCTTFKFPYKAFNANDTGDFCWVNRGSVNTTAVSQRLTLTCFAGWTVDVWNGTLKRRCVARDYKFESFRTRSTHSTGIVKTSFSFGISSLQCLFMYTVKKPIK